MDPFMSLLRSRQRPALKGDTPVRAQDASQRKSWVAAASAAAVSVMEDAATTVPNLNAGGEAEQIVAVRPGEQHGTRLG